MLSGRSARRHARGRKTKSVIKNDAEDTAMVASEMKRFWIVYDTEGIWRGEIKLKLNRGLFWLCALWFLITLDIIEERGAQDRSSG